MQGLRKRIQKTGASAAALLSLAACLAVFTSCNERTTGSSGEDPTAPSAQATTTAETSPTETQPAETTGTTQETSGAATVSKSTVTGTQKRPHPSTGSAAEKTTSPATPPSISIKPQDTYDYEEKAKDGTFVKGGESGWVLDWGDDFNGTKLNTKIWKKEQDDHFHDRLADTDPFRHLPQKFSYDAIYLDGMGHLVMEITNQNGTYVSGSMESVSKYDRTYGYYEIRCILPKSEAVGGSFWMMPRSMPLGTPPTGGMEIDIFECPYWRKGGVDGKYIAGMGVVPVGSIVQTVHWGGYQDPYHQSVNNGHYYPKDKRETGAGFFDEYHVYGLKWTPKELIFYVDGVESFRTDGNGQGVTQVPEYVILSCGITSWAGKAENLELPVKYMVDYVRVFKNDKYQAG